MEDSLHPAAVAHLPPFITAPGQTDVLFNMMIVFVLLMVFVVGILYLRLHALPEHMAHGASKVQLQIVGVLALIALFTHNHLFWIAALLLAMVEIPNFSSPVESIARSLAKMADRHDGTDEPGTSAQPAAMPPRANESHASPPQWVPLEIEPVAGDDKAERRG
ncbi:hypothetical protein SM0020_22222 [Sinorhizobium meliloti CCNWSX0020]|uniref:Transmembrane protein n=1 Tax=Sinorhizobium meliloti CCNWSX0020 TaxID=1107881 RepID=H0G4P0_RHIML|nr:hypothetical protein [Sinorhizobium meliloti]EHK75750.1 hypothetical protein SM0020_22222 [Sinorhizobium meliloti CCNWSX0020]RVG60601.1 hypothetical protein CN220_31760 [Sinorhizobium meliloti]RVH42709.1 hypothetical protein CN212_28270 [Sinorhizobium meliloti]